LRRHELTDNAGMFWWFERGGKFLRYEARTDAQGFEFCVVEPDGSERTERFTESRELARRQVEFEQAVRDQGWSGPHGWNL
jgi:hypothetical protein